ncbi:hypothetical protein SteCoe_11373 [Stentor coeruleus]|uniref:Uncharacterized protein n=1 Tax=Stentor coeruleus TaxID=5963 RepID=A0A1R2CD93_9CILI|nr:hypothetical protein SteCoe_11373 [Stentor coeruleus]
MERKAFHEVMPKTSYYRTNGTGRDTYIAYDNGGTFQPMMSLKSCERTSSRPKSSVSKSSTRSLHYISDGTGRDTYIRVSDGGLHSSTSPKYFLNTFKDSLREYSPVKNSNDFFVRTQTNWKTNKERIFTRTMHRKVQRCVNRLYKTT